MNEGLKKYLGGDSVIWIIYFILCVFSVVELYSASSTLAYKMDSHTAPILQHITFLIGGAILAFLVHFVPYKYIRILSYAGLVVSLLLLIYVYFKGESANEANRWIRILGIQFQPSELAKLSLIVVVADLISRIRANPGLEKKFFLWILGVSIPIVGLIFFDNLSTAAILGLTVFAMMFIGRISWKKMLSIVGAVAILLVVVFIAVKVVPKDKMPKALKRADTWVNRVEDVVNDKKEESKFVINDDNLQVQHGRIAVARGGFFGVFPGNSVERDYLPHAYDDFIYAIIIEEMGMIGGIIVILLYLWLLFRTGQIATVCRSTFPAILVTGLGLIITLQAAVNMFVGSGFGLVTGQPLPLISRGGTSILITSIYFGIILGVVRELKLNNEMIQKKTSEVSVEDLVNEKDSLVEASNI